MTNGMEERNEDDRDRMREWRAEVTNGGEE
jgi:hypothetical protein